LLLESSTFYVDDCLGKTVAVKLRESGWKIEWHRDHFQRDKVQDTEIYEYIGNLGWHFLTKDKALRRKPIEIDRMLECGIRVFSLAGNDMNSEEMADCFVRNRLAIGRLLKNHSEAFVAYIRKDSATIPQQVIERMESAKRRIADAKK